MKLELDFSLNERGLMEAQFIGKLVSVSNTTHAFTKGNKTKFRPSSVNIQGYTIKSIVYEKSFNKGCITGSDVIGSITYDPNDLSKDPFVAVIRIAEFKLSHADYGVVVEKTTKATKAVKPESDVL